MAVGGRSSCPTKLFYTGKPNEYVDRSVKDDFLLSLADNGFQVGALAQVMFPDGVIINGRSVEDRVALTKQLMSTDGGGTLFEAAVACGDLLVLVDVLEFKGEMIALTEVKAKSYSPEGDGDFRKKRGQGFSSDFLPYLLDVAFQHYVVQSAFPGKQVNAFLMLVDKSARCSVDGLNQRFRIRRIAEGKSVVDVAAGTDVRSVGAPLLRRVDVTSQVLEIQRGKVSMGSREIAFPDAVRELSEAFRDDVRIVSAPGAQCKDCEFRADPVAGLRSGFRECWSSAFNWTNADFTEVTVLDLHGFRKKDALLQRGTVKLRDMSREDLGAGEEEDRDGGLTTIGRQALQLRAAHEPGLRVVMKEALMRSMEGWRYPLHFIDFETCMVPIPFNAGRRPFEQIAFQFSHHTLDADGRVRHAGQFLDPNVGISPNIDFLRALRSALSTDDGSVFRWHTHENTVLRQLRDQLLAEHEAIADREDLINFIDSITSWAAGKDRLHGPRTMIDLCALAERHYFDDSTRGGSSLKVVLPALMRSSQYLREHYSQPRYGRGAEIHSENFARPVAWWTTDAKGHVVDPYRLLPPLFPDVDRDEQEAFELGLGEGLREGGAAMTAYARLQVSELDADLRGDIRQALLQYCELDTLAMAMVVQAWKNH